MAEIHFCISFDTETKMWKSADEAMGGFFTNGFVWDEDKDEWRGLNYDDPKEVDIEYEASEQVGLLLKQMNGLD